MLQVAGTMHWMAPEVLIHGRCTEKADIFRCGHTVWLPWRLVWDSK